MCQLPYINSEFHNSRAPLMWYNAADGYLTLNASFCEEELVKKGREP